MRQARQRQSQVCGVHGRGLSGFGQQVHLWPLSIPDPAAELEQAAAEQRADLIVVGSQGHTVVERLLLGSVSTRLTHHAQRPVMVVPLT